ncbi:MAG: DUF2783 domain-containing protein [Sphingobium sp.]
MPLITETNIADPDSIYERLIMLHEGCDEEESMRINARLILLLINHIGDTQVIGEAIDCAARR